MTFFGYFLRNKKQPRLFGKEAEEKTKKQFLCCSNHHKPFIQRAFCTQDQYVL